VFKLEIR